MISYFIAGCMWLLWLTFILLRRRRTRHTITWSAFAIALSMTLNLDPVFIAVDKLLGGNNWADLIGNGTLMIGLFLLARGVTYAHPFRTRYGRIALGSPALVMAVTIAAIAFVLIDRGETTTAFMAELGAQPAAAVYSITQYAYCGIVISALGISCLYEVSRTTGSARVAVALILTGTVLAAATCILIIAMDVVHLVGNEPVLGALQTVYDPMYAGAIAFLCAGLALGPIMRTVSNTRRWATTARLVRELRPAWETAVMLRPSLTRLGVLTMSARSAEETLHRQVVEIRDVAGQSSGIILLTATDESLLEIAEEHLMTRSAPALT